MDLKALFYAEVDSLPLTNRRKHVVCLLLDGKTRAEMMSELDISDAGVRRSLERIRQKLGLIETHQIHVLVRDRVEESMNREEEV